jgi:hypothetical protein
LPAREFAGVVQQKNSVGENTVSASPEIPIGPRVLRAIEVAYRARRPVLLEGPTGIGKSEVVRQVCDQLGIAVRVLDLSLLEPPDLVGLPYVADHSTVYAVPKCLPRDGNGILMLEELNRAERYIQQPALQLLTDRCLHDYSLPPGWSTCAAINPETGDYQVTPLDLALKLRFLHLRVRADKTSWLAWARKNEVHPSVIALVEGHDRIFESVPPRSLKYVSDILQVIRAEEVRDTTLLRDLLGGYLPSTWIEVLLDDPRRLLLDLGIDPYEVLAEYHRNGELKRKLKDFRDAGTTDRVDLLVDRIKAILRDRELGQIIDRGRFDPPSFAAFLSDLPGDLREDLQEAYGANPLSAKAERRFKGADVIKHYTSKGIQTEVRNWMRSPGDRHRVLSLLTDVAAHIERSRDLLKLRMDGSAMRNLGQLIHDVGPLLSKHHLPDVLRRLNVEPRLPN